jgi:exo-1,4-beta-D-glucosaminidase
MTRARTASPRLAANLVLTCAVLFHHPVCAQESIELHEGWRIAAAAGVEAEAPTVSGAGFDTAGWVPAAVPSTPMAALVRSGAVENPYVGRNLEKISAAPFEGPWWYRTEFTVDAPAPGAELIFEGINYSAEVWLNGEKIADRSRLTGAFRNFGLDVSKHLVAGVNALAVLVYPPQPGDPSIGFVDWNPPAPDRNMGLWRPVTLRLTGAVSLEDVFVRSKVDLDAGVRAALTLGVTLHNRTADAVEAALSGTIDGGIEVHARASLAPHEKKKIVLTPARYPQLDIGDPRLWWPNGLGEPNLYGLDLRVEADGELSDRSHVTFGIRRVDDYVDAQGHRGYAVNGHKFLIRGGGWVDDLLLADDAQRIEDQLRYVRHMHLNTIRLEGFWGSSQALYDLADRYGILVMVGWSCQWEWENYLGAPVDEYGGIDTPDEMELITRSLVDQVRRLRNHPSVLVWVLGSDKLPRPGLERRFRDALADEDPSRPRLAACAAGVSEVSGPTGVKMNGPYDWVSPNYWTLDTEHGGAFGFNTETGPGPQPPPAASIRRMLPRDSWWPPDALWDYHSGRGEFHSIARYAEALDRRYGTPSDLDEFARLAQVANYEAMRAMFEAFTIRRPATTGIIQWMLNSAWPEFYWQLYDYYLVPNGAFYGARDGSRPVNIAYDYSDRGVVVVNETDAELAGVTARMRIYDLESQMLLDESRTLDAGAGTLQRVLTLPEVGEAAGNAYFVDLRLIDAGGAAEGPLATSLYWLSTRKDIPDWEGSLWYVTPLKQYADLTGLARMPRVELDASHAFESTGDGYELRVTLSNPTDRIAFFVGLEVVGAESGRIAAPALWSDNYVSLMPGEARSIRAWIPAHALAGERPVFRYTGVNVLGE